MPKSETSPALCSALGQAATEPSPATHRAGPGQREPAAAPAPAPRPGPGADPPGGRRGPRRGGARGRLEATHLNAHRAVPGLQQRRRAEGESETGWSAAPAAGPGAGSDSSSSSFLCSLVAEPGRAQGGGAAAFAARAGRVCRDGAQPTAESRLSVSLRLVSRPRCEAPAPVPGPGESRRVTPGCRPAFVPSLRGGDLGESQARPGFFYFW